MAALVGYSRDLKYLTALENYLLNGFFSCGSPEPISTIQR
jgi:hypothetical protein